MTSRGRSRLFIAAAAGALSLVACAPGDRADVVHEALTRDNRDLALRDPREVAARFARMAQDPFSFLRGSIGLWARDVSTPGAPGFARSGYADGTAAGVLLVGDPHPENLGTGRIDGGLVFGFNDYDVARFGPAVLDVRRLALGFAVGFHAIDPAVVDDSVRAVALGYAAGLRGGIDASIDRDQALGDSDRFGPVVGDLLARARSEGEARAELAELTRPVTNNAYPGSVLAAVEDVPESLEAEVLLLPSADEVARVRAALAAVGLSAVEVARVLGRGVGSRPLLRYLALLDDADGGRRLVQLKEARDPFVLEGYAAEHSRFFDDNAARVVFARRRLLGENGADAFLHKAPFAPGGAVTTEETGYAQTLRLRRVRDDVDGGRYGGDALAGLAFEAGRALAQAHRRGVTVDGRDADEPLVAALGINDERDAAALADETLAATRDALPTALDDVELLRELLDRHGPLLGLPAGGAP